MILKDKFKELPIEYKLSIIASVMVILILFFRWTLPLLIETFLIIIVFTFFMATALGSLIYLVINRQKVKQSYMPLLIQLITVLILIIVPITKFTVLVDFWFNLSQREKVVEMIQNGKLTINKSEENDNYNVILLPWKYRHLSKGGEVFVIDKGSAVWFYTYSGGFIEQPSGFIYMKKGKPDPYIFQNDFEGYLQEIDKLKDNWYWGARSSLF